MEDVDFLVNLEQKEKELQDKKEKGEIKVCNIEDKNCENCGA